MEEMDSNHDDKKERREELHAEYEVCAETLETLVLSDRSSIHHASRRRRHTVIRMMAARAMRTQALSA